MPLVFQGQPWTMLAYGGTGSVAPYTILINKNNAGWTSPAGSVAAAGGSPSGWFIVLMDSADTNVSGDLAISVTDALGNPVLAINLQVYISIEADLLTWQGSTPANLDIRGYVLADVFSWAGETVNALSSDGGVPANVVDWAGEAVNGLSIAGNVICDVQTVNGFDINSPDESGNLTVDVVFWAGKSVPTNTPGTACLDLVDSPNTRATGAIATAWLNLSNAIEGTYTPGQCLTLYLAALTGPSPDPVAGVRQYFDPTNAHVRIQATTDVYGARSDITLTP